MNLNLNFPQSESGGFKCELLRSQNDASHPREGNPPIPPLIPILPIQRENRMGRISPYPG
jgi:hypothetical protein